MISEHTLQPVADTLFNYLRDVIYDPANASLDIEQLPEEFRNFGKGLQFFSNIVTETTVLAKELANGNLNCALPPPSNEIAAPLKALHASLRHLTWQSQQVAKGDYQQHVDFMGDFSEAFNNMTKQLEQRQKITLDEKTRLERYVDLLLANCPDPILLFDKQERLAYASDSYLKRRGLASAGGILGRTLSELFAPVVSKDFLRYLEDMFKTAAAETRTVETAHDIDFDNSGSRRNYQIQVTPMLGENGANEGVMAILHDTTEIVRARREAERARAIAERSSQAKSDFLARMSHEMRTPMNAIIGMAAISQASDDPARKEYCLGKIGEASQHLLGVINDVLDMSKIEADKFELSSGSFDFGKMIERVTGVMQFRVDERKQRFTAKIDPAIPNVIITDEQRLAQVITNLLANAVKFTPEGGAVSLTVEKISEMNSSCILQFAVRDNGIGISGEQQKRLFMPFEQADGGVARKYGGTGLGLAISKRIVEMMGGIIWVQSKVGQGASFFFQIPVEKDMSYHNAQPIPAQDTAEPDTEDGVFLGKRILLAEDVEINREILAALLEHTGVRIDMAEDGRQALEMFSGAAPGFYDLIFMDIHMPNMDGYEATRRIRGSDLPGANTIPIIAMTANVFREDVERCLACGMSSHLGKPIDAAEVIERLRKYLL